MSSSPEKSNHVNYPPRPQGVATRSTSPNQFHKGQVIEFKEHDRWAQAKITDIGSDGNNVTIKVASGESYTLFSNDYRIRSISKKTSGSFQGIRPPSPGRRSKSPSARNSKTPPLPTALPAGKITGYPEIEPTRTPPALLMFERPEGSSDDSSYLPDAAHLHPQPVKMQAANALENYLTHPSTGRPLAPTETPSEKSSSPKHSPPSTGKSSISWNKNLKSPLKDRRKHRRMSLDFKGYDRCFYKGQPVEFKDKQGLWVPTFVTYISKDSREIKVNADTSNLKHYIFAQDCRVRPRATINNLCAEDIQELLTLERDEPREYQKRLESIWADMSTNPHIPIEAKAKYPRKFTFKMAECFLWHICQEVINFGYPPDQLMLQLQRRENLGKEIDAFVMATSISTLLSGVLHQASNMLFRSDVIGSEMKQDFESVYRITGTSTFDQDRQLRPLGQGGFGSVHLVEDRATCKLFAAKKLPKVSLKPAELKKEISLLMRFDHVNVIKLHQVFDEPTHVVLVQEFCSGGNILDAYQAMKNAGMASIRGEALAWLSKVFKDVLHGLKYIHGLGCIHRDLKEENIMLVLSSGHDKSKPVYTQQVSACIIDIGLADAVKEEGAANKAGSFEYMAPEVWFKNPEAKSDIWSLGVVMFRFFTGYMPFPLFKTFKAGWGAFDPRKIQEWFANCSVKKDKNNEYPNWKLLDGRGIPKSVKRLLRHMLVMPYFERKKVGDRDCSTESKRTGCIPSSRWTAEECLTNCDWFSNDESESCQIDSVVLDSILQHRQKNIFQKAVIQKIGVNFVGIQAPQIKHAFLNFDVDNDGILTLDDACQSLEDLGLSEQEALKVAKNMDLNNDGRIDWSEFVSSAITCSGQVMENALHDVFKTHCHKPIFDEVFHKGRLSKNDSVDVPNSVAGVPSENLIEMKCWRLPEDKTFYRAKLVDFKTGPGTKRSEPSIIVSWLSTNQGGPPPHDDVQKIEEIPRSQWHSNAIHPQRPFSWRGAYLTKDNLRALVADTNFMKLDCYNVDDESADDCINEIFSVMDRKNDGKILFESFHNYFETTYDLKEQPLLTERRSLHLAPLLSKRSVCEAMASTRKYANTKPHQSDFAMNDITTPPDKPISPSSTSRPRRRKE